MRPRLAMKRIMGLVALVILYQGIAILWNSQSFGPYWRRRDNSILVNQAQSLQSSQVLLLKQSIGQDESTKKQTAFIDNASPKNPNCKVEKPWSMDEPQDGSDYQFLSRLERQMRSWHWSWISRRIRTLWPHWVNASRALSAEPFMRARHRLKILIVPGVLTQTPYAKEAFIKRGGALGDLLQWADLVAAAHALGHDVTLFADLRAASSHLQRSLEKSSSPACSGYDLVFSDYAGFEKMAPNVLDGYKCRLRVIDAYGTEPAFNHRAFAAKRNMKFAVGKMSLHPKQMYTFYPHTPDNTFLGFAVPPIERSVNTTKENVALLYGKNYSYFKDRRPLIKKLLEKFEVHATVANKAGLPPEVKNHGIVNGQQYRALMEKAKVLVSVGNPTESSGAIEALARGMIILQPVFTGMRRITVLKGKPTSRQLSSQIPYLENFVGPPHAYTVDYDDNEKLDAALAELTHTEVEPFHPREFTMEGMLERLAVLFEKQDFCGDSPITWPPRTSLLVHKSAPGEDCIETCFKKGLTCEPVYYPFINGSDFKRWNVSCSGHQVEQDIWYPAVRRGASQRTQCISQSDKLLFSCAGHHVHLTRICPCRDYIPYQITLCRDCFKYSSQHLQTMTNRPMQRAHRQNISNNSKPMVDEHQHILDRLVNFKRSIFS